jgi:hypothetical protein
MCGKPKAQAAQAPIPKPDKPDTTVANRGADSAVDASLGRRVGATDETKPGTLGGGGAPAGGPTSSVLGG